MLYCNLYRNWHWHYMWFTVIDPWNYPCKATVLTHICLTLNSFCQTHERGNVKPLSCHRMALHGFTLVSPWNCPCTQSHFLQYIRIAWVYTGRPWNCLCKASVSPNIRITQGSPWSAHKTAHVKPFFQTFALHGIHINQPMISPTWSHCFATYW